MFGDDVDQGAAHDRGIGMATGLRHVLGTRNSKPHRDGQRGLLPYALQQGARVVRHVVARAGDPETGDDVEESSTQFRRAPDPFIACRWADQENWIDAEINQGSAERFGLLDGKVENQDAVDPEPRNPRQARTTPIVSANAS